MTEEDNLISEKAVDYHPLQGFLKANKWREADYETYRVVISIRSQDAFPCLDLGTIDRLWVKYSDGRFGFSIQNRIWKEVQHDNEYFFDRVGWRQDETRLSIPWEETAIYDDSVPAGYLPVLIYNAFFFHDLFHRWEACNVVM